MKKVNIDFVNVNIYYFESKKKYDKYCKKHKIDEPMYSDGLTTVLTKGSKIGFLITIDNVEDQLEWEGVLVHEISHVITELFKWYGFSCDELRSYLMQYIYQSIKRQLMD